MRDTFSYKAQCLFYLVHTWAVIVFTVFIGTSTLVELVLGYLLYSIYHCSIR